MEEGQEEDTSEDEEDEVEKEEDEEDETFKEGRRVTGVAAPPRSGAAAARILACG